ncbi:MAG TPA: hypothetical protein VLG44_06205 [Chlamydiales bacterium]|nr:hypothetical protein [Chlamydiales bacterium]
MSVTSSERASNDGSIFSFPENGYARLGYISVGGLWVITNVFNFGIMQLLGTTVLAGAGLYAINRLANPHKGDTFFVSFARDLEKLICCCCKNKPSKGLDPKRVHRDRTISLRNADVDITRQRVSS